MDKITADRRKTGWTGFLWFVLEFIKILVCILVDLLRGLWHWKKPIIFFGVLIAGYIFIWLSGMHLAVKIILSFLLPSADFILLFSISELEYLLAKKKCPFTHSRHRHVLCRLFNFNEVSKDFSECSEAKIAANKVKIKPAEWRGLVLYIPSVHIF